MSRIKKLELDDWDKELREMTAADSGTPLEQGAMRMFAHTPEISKGLTAFAGSLNNLTDKKADIEFRTGKLSIFIDEKNSIHMKGPISDIKEISIKL